MRAPRQFSLKVTLVTATGLTIVRPVTLTAVSAIVAKQRAAVVTPKPGQTVVNVTLAAR